MDSALRQFGRYRLLEQIGSGGMAIVYRAVLAEAGDRGTQLVIKRVRPEYARDASFAKMLTQEARLYALLDHPSIIRLEEHGQVGNESFMAMEYVEGVDLRALLAHCATVKRWIPIDVACHIAIEVASALEYAHTLHDAAGRPLEIVHRDISPSNIMVTPDGAVKLLDFGIAKAAEHIRDERTRTGTIKGKLSYFSPEQADGLPLDGRSDLFALGIVLMEMLTLRRVFRGKGDFDTLRRVREARSPRLTTLRPDADADLERVVARALERLPDDRYATARELIDALRASGHADEGAESLRRFLAELGPISRVDPDDFVQTAASDPPVAAGTSSLVVLHRRTGAIVVGIGALVLAMIGGFVLRRLDTPPPIVAIPPVVAPPTVVVPPAPVVVPPPVIVPPVPVVTARTEPIEKPHGKHKPPASHRDKPHASSSAPVREDPNDVKDPFSR